jgi:hypothetical protein
MAAQQQLSSLSADRLTVLHLATYLDAADFIRFSAASRVFAEATADARADLVSTNCSPAVVPHNNSALPTADVFGLPLCRQKQTSAGSCMLCISGPPMSSAAATVLRLCRSCCHTSKAVFGSRQQACSQQPNCCCSSSSLLAPSSSSRTTQLLRSCTS